MLYITNAFTLDMLPHDVEVSKVVVRRMPPDRAANVVNFTTSRPIVNAIRHPVIDAAVREQLAREGCELPKGQPTPVSLKPGDEMVVAQYVGPPLPQEAWDWPEGAKIEYFFIYVIVEEE